MFVYATNNYASQHRLMIMTADPQALRMRLAWPKRIFLRVYAWSLPSPVSISQFLLAEPVEDVIAQVQRYTQQ